LHAAAGAEDVEGALLVDDDGRPQWLAGVWRFDALAARIPAHPAGVGMREVLGGLRFAVVTAPNDRPPAWFDCDTESDVRLAEEWSDAR